RPLLERVDLVDGRLEGPGDVLIRFLGEPDVAVADLDEREAPSRRSFGPSTEGAGGEETSAHRPDEPRAGPGHALQEPATIDAVALAVVVYVICHFRNSPSVHGGADLNAGRAPGERYRTLAPNTPERPRRMAPEGEGRRGRRRSAPRRGGGPIQR